MNDVTDLKLRQLTDRRLELLKRRLEGPGEAADYARLSRDFWVLVCCQPDPAVRNELAARDHHLVRQLLQAG